MVRIAPMKRNAFPTRLHSLLVRKYVFLPLKFVTFSVMNLYAQEVWNYRPETGA